MNVPVAAGEAVSVYMQWDDPFGASGNDYDLWLLNAAETDVLCEFGCVSRDLQDGNDDPVEAVCYHNNTADTVSVRVAVQKYFGADRYLELFISSAPSQYNGPADSVVGHAAVPGVLAVAAIDAGDPGHDEIEFFSSRGPSTIRIPGQVIRQKPDIAGIDGVRVTGAGGFVQTFFGTSASPPHIAAIAALLRGAAPDASAAAIRSALKQGAVDPGAAGPDRIFGAGRADALASLVALDPDRDRDGVGDFDEIAQGRDPSVNEGALLQLLLTILEANDKSP